MGANGIYQGNGQGFLTDYSGLAAAGSAFQGFAEGYQNAQDRQLKRQESMAQIDALKAKMQRESDQSQIDYAKQGYQKDPSTGEITPGPLSPATQAENTLKAGSAGMKVSSQDQYGTPTGYEFDPNSAKGMGFDIQKQKNDAMMEMMQQRMGLQDQRQKLMEERLQKQQGQQAEGTMDKDPVLTQFMPRVAGAQKILNLMDNAEKGGATDVKSNQALLGQVNAEIARLETGSQSPGLGASEKTEMEDAHARLMNLKDTVLGGVTPVNLHSKFEQGRALVRDLGTSYLGAVNDRHDYLKSGVNDPDKLRVMQGKQDFFNQRYQSVFNPPAQGQAPGMVKPGLVGAGLTGGQQQAPSAASHPDAGTAAKWASDTLADKNATKDDKAKATAIKQRLGQ